MATQSQVLPSVAREIYALGNCGSSQIHLQESVRQGEPVLFEALVPGETW